MSAAGKGEGRAPLRGAKGSGKGVGSSGRRDDALLREIVSRAEGEGRGGEKPKLARKGSTGRKKAPGKASKRGVGASGSGGPSRLWRSGNLGLAALALGIVGYGIVGLLDVGSSALDRRLLAGDVLVLEGISARFSAPSAGRLVEVRQRGGEVPRALGRVVAVDGDAVEWAGGRLEVNGAEASLPGDLGRLGRGTKPRGRGRRLARTPASLGLPGGRLEVPRDHLYVTVDEGGRIEGRVIPIGDVTGVALVAVGGGRGWAARLPRWVF